MLLGDHNTTWAIKLLAVGPCFLGYQVTSSWSMLLGDHNTTWAIKLLAVGPCFLGYQVTSSWSMFLGLSSY